MGTVWTKAAVYNTESGKYQLVRMDDEQDNTDEPLWGDEYACPTAVMYANGDKTKPVVGKRAVRSKNTDPDNFHHLFKPYLAGKDAQKWTGCVADVLRYVLEKAKKQTRTRNFDKVVITVPSATMENDTRWNTMAEAARMAGMDDVELVREPAAAGYHVMDKEIKDGKAKDGATFLVYDLGGGTFDPAILEARNGSLRVVGEWGAMRGKDIGGIYIDGMIREDIKARNTLFQQAEDMMDSTPLDEHGRPVLDNAETRNNYLLARRRIERLSQMAVEAKHFISKEQKTFRASEWDGSAYELEPEDFEEEMLEPLIDDTIQCCRQMEALGCSWKDIEKVFLVGGSSMFPLVKRILEETRQKEKAHFKIETHKDEKGRTDILHAVAIGAAKYPALQPTAEQRTRYGKESLQKGDLAEAEHQFTKAGNFFYLGMMAYMGLGMQDKRKNYRKAAELFRKDGGRQARLILGRMYFLGQGVKKDDKAAAQLLQSTGKGKDILKVMDGTASPEETERAYKADAFLDEDDELKMVLGTMLETSTGQGCNKKVGDTGDTATTAAGTQPPATKDDKEERVMPAREDLDYYNIIKLAGL